MNYIKIKTNDVANGEGVRVSLWLSGCTHHCLGCQNPETWNPNVGQALDEAAKQRIWAELRHPWIQGLTLSGGDPLYPDNKEELFLFLAEVRVRFPKKDIWMWTGYDIETLLMDYNYTQILSLVDVLVDGKYEQDKRDITLEWRGSSNQRIIDCRKTLTHWKWDDNPHPEWVYLWRNGDYK